MGSHLGRGDSQGRLYVGVWDSQEPVVAFDCDGAGEVCLDGETGALIPPGDLAKLEDSLLRLAKDEALRQSLGQSGQAFVKEKFTVERLVEDQYQLYQRLLAKR